MIIECLYDTGEVLLDVHLQSRWQLRKNRKFENVVIGKDYVVYAKEILNELVFYYIADEDFMGTPKCYPSELFKVIDSRDSKYWFCEKLNVYGDEVIITSYDSWAKDAFYYSKLEDREPTALDEFLTFKTKMDLEYAFPGIESYAEDIGDNWYLCPECSEAWAVEIKSQDELVKCPNCKTILLVN